MDWPVRAFVKASLTWLALGVTLGVCMAVHPGWTIYRPAHEHMNLLGFVTMMIFGVAYHVVPRFAGHPLWRRNLAVWHWWVANAGLALMVVGLALRVRTDVPLASSGAILGGGGVLSALGAYVFVINIWRTIDGSTLARAAAARVNAATPSGRPSAAPVGIGRRARAEAP